MASNLNKAFMRAYAKDSGRAATVPAADNAIPTAAANRPQATEGGPQPAFRPAAAKPSPGAPSVGHPPIAAPHLHPQSPAPTPIVAGRYVQKSGTQNAMPKPIAAASSDPTTVANAANAASVWQRIDVAQSIQPPHVTNPPSRPITASVGVGSTSGPKRMYAAAAVPIATAPLAPDGRAAGLQQPQATDLPLLPDEPNAPPADPQALEARRRTVADFLYSAGKVSASAARTPVSVTSGPGSAAGSVSVKVSANPSAPSPSLGSQGRAGAPLGERSHAPAATAVPSPLYASSPAYAAASIHPPVPVHAPVKLPQPAALPGSLQTPALQPPANRAGQILRVDVPLQSRHSAVETARTASAAHAAIDPAMIQPAPVQRAAVQPAMLEPATLAQTGWAEDGAVAAAGATVEQRRVDRAHELSDAEQNLRCSMHKIFNPVWEVDSLQWPGVCDKLMEHRAESMAQVAAHLKAACQDGLSILGVTSPTSGEGRTTVACCLARLAAAHGLNVALVDLDLEHPTLCLQTNLEVEHDWRDCLHGDIDLEEVAVHSIDDQLTLLPLRDRAEQPELLASDIGIAEILRELSESFELVIVDACRMDSSGNVITSLAAANVFDAAIVVVDRRNSHQERIEDSVRALQQTGVGSIGIVDNFSM